MFFLIEFVSNESNNNMENSLELIFPFLDLYNIIKIIFMDQDPLFLYNKLWKINTLSLQNKEANKVNGGHRRKIKIKKSKLRESDYTIFTYH